MRIINSCNEIAQCYICDSFNIDAWRNYAYKICPSLVGKCEDDIKDYNYENDILPVVNYLISNCSKIEKVNESFNVVSDTLKQRMSVLFDRDIDLDIILYLGLCNGAGWATTLDDRNVILLGIEKIVELEWYDVEIMQNLIFHEIGHIWHKTYGKFSMCAITQKEKSIQQLYQEGIAMICEQILCQNERYYHQDRNGWLDWCVSNEDEIKIEYLKRLKNNESTQDFFGDWNKYKSYSDVGYYLGCQFIKYLQNKYTLKQIANMDLNSLIILYDEYSNTRNAEC